MQRSTAALCLLFALMTRSAFPHAADRLKVEVVQTHTGVKFDSPLLELPSPPSGIVMRCSGTSGTYSREFGYYCNNAEPESNANLPQNRRREAFFYDVTVIMPDDAHLILHCSSILEKQCDTFPSYPEKTSVTCSNFSSDNASYKDCTASGDSRDGIGVYKASLHGDKVTIFGASWKRVYLKYGTWQEPGAQENPSAPQDSKASPATPPPAADGTTINPQVIEDARGGDRIAQYKLGYDYYLGRGLAQDYAQAAEWWKRAAEQGYADAQNNLGVLYNSGKGVPQSYSEAYFWENLAAARANGKLQAQFAKNRDDSATRLGFFERLRVQKRAAKWAAAHPVPAKTADKPADHP